MVFYIIFSVQMELVNIVEYAVASVQSVIPPPVIVHHVEQEWSSSRTDVSVWRKPVPQVGTIWVVTGEKLMLLHANNKNADQPVHMLRVHTRQGNVREI